MKLNKAHIKQLFGLGRLDPSDEYDFIEDMIKQLNVIKEGLGESDKDNNEHQATSEEAIKIYGLVVELRVFKQSIENMGPNEEDELINLIDFMKDIKKVLGDYLNKHNKGILPDYYVALCVLDILNIDPKELSGNGTRLAIESRVEKSLEAAVNQNGLQTRIGQGRFNWHRTEYEYFPAMHDILDLASINVTWPALVQFLSDAVKLNALQNSSENHFRDFILNVKLYQKAILIYSKHFGITQSEYDEGDDDYKEITETIDEYKSSFIINCKYLQLLTDSLKDRNGKSYRQCVQEWDQQVKDKISSQAISDTDRFGTSRLVENNGETSMPVYQ